MKKTMIETMIEEKGIDLETVIEIDGQIGLTVGAVLEFIYHCPKEIQSKIAKTLIQIDFRNGDIMDYIRYLANGMVTKF